MFEIRDPIHRTIPFSLREKQVIDHLFVQRLRHVRQLGLSFLVYPGATHDRFSHVVGAMHVVGRMWDGMMKTSGDVLQAHFTENDLAYFRSLLRFAALLHDIGHPPFSHVSEKLMPHFSALVIPQEWIIGMEQERQARHEDYSVVLIASLVEDSSVDLSKDELQDIASLVHHGITPSHSWREKFGDAEKVGIHRLLRSLISGELDCDRADYLLRDSYFTGVAYGSHDIDHLIANMGVVKKDGVLMRTIDATAVRAFEDFLLARYHMFLQVYMHKTTIAFDYFLNQALEHKEFTMDIPGDAAGYAELRDSTMIEKMFIAAKNKNNTWTNRLVGRKPPKLLLVSSNGRDEEKNVLQKTMETLDENGIPYFTVTTKQYLSKWGHVNEGYSSGMLVRKKMLAKFIYEPIEHHSSLLQKYNEVIDATHLYVLPEHFSSAEPVIHNIKIK